MALTEQTHKLISDHFADTSKGLAVDATCGNGYDTEFLLRAGFKEILAFDIQQVALDSTQARVANLKAQHLSLILDGHQNMATYLNEPVDCVMFNLGYLPTANKQLTTQPKTTLAALSSAAVNIRDGGMISVMCYPGHPAGKEETALVKQWASELDETWACSITMPESPKPTAPILLLMKKTPRNIKI